MSNTVIKAEDVSKLYRLGQLGTGTVSHDLKRWWASVKGKEDPFMKVGVSNDRAQKSKSEYAWALKDINFEIAQGDTVGIIGKNGAGKSTLLKLLAKVTSPSTGQIKINGRISSLLEVGTGFHPEMTGRENVYMNGAILGMTKKEISRKFDEIVEFAGVEMYIDTPVKRYSSGMSVRLAFAVAANLEPDILIVDEVLAVGDAEFQQKCLGKMNDMNSSVGRTILFVSHDITAIRNLCKTAILLDKGTIKSIGKTDVIIEEYSKAISSSDGWDFSRRRGDQTLHIKDIIFTNAKGIPSKEFYSGDEVNIRFVLNKPISNSDYNKLQIILEVSNALKRKVFSVSNRYAPNVFSSEPKNYLDCKINSLMLAQGSYFLDLFMEFSNGFADDLREFGTITVMPSDFYKTGYGPIPRYHGEMLIEQTWS